MQRTVLISDDEPRLLSSLADVARACGLSVISDGTSRAYELAREHHPDVVLLDMNQKVRGPELLRQLKADPQTRSIPVVMITGCYEPEDRRTCTELGAEYCELKPMRADFWERLRLLLDLRARETALRTVE